MIRLRDLPALIIMVALLVMVIWFGGLLGITEPTLTQFARSIPDWLGVTIVFILGLIVAVASFYLWRVLLAKLTGKRPDFEP